MCNKALRNPARILCPRNIVNCWTWKALTIYKTRKKICMHFIDVAFKSKCLLWQIAIGNDVWASLLIKYTSNPFWPCSWGRAFLFNLQNTKFSNELKQSDGFSSKWMMNDKINSSTNSIELFTIYRIIIITYWWKNMSIEQQSTAVYN